MTTSKHTSRSLTLILGCALAVTPLQAIDYTWDSASNERWGTATNWSPEGIPGTGDNVVGASAGGNLEIRDHQSVDNFTYSGGIGAWQLVGIGEISLTINDTLALTGADNINIRKSTGANEFSIIANNVDVSSTGVLLFGAGNSTNNVFNVTINGTTSVSNGQIRFNVENDYSMGTVDVSGNGRIYLSSAPQDTGAIQATATGLVGTGGTVQSALFSGNTTTLRLNGSGNYNSSTNLLDSEGSLVLVKAGTGTQTLGGNNQHTGGTQVDSGTLIIADSRALGDGDVIVNGGTLTSTVSATDVEGQLRINGGVVSIEGGGVGSFNMTAGQDMTLDGGTLEVSYDSESETHDTISSAGGGSSFDLLSGTIDLTNSDWDYSIVYTILDGFDTGSVGEIDFINYDSANWQASLSDTGVLSFSGIPEPSAGSFIFLPSLCALTVLLRRRRAC